MNERPRRGLALLLAGALLAGGSAWLFLKLGRPAFYSDGARELRSLDLRGASVLLWSRPEPEAEIPGPVQGRVQDLPDGRLIYGRVLADGTTDLVLYDPRRPGVPPEAAVGLNSPGHDLAPALGEDGTLYFASDRPGGAGGFDLYASRWNGATFSSPRRLPDTINSPDDEADPAPAPDGARLVFVRREPEVRDGRNGRLMHADPSGEAIARPVLTEAALARNVIDRDPTLTPDGVSLWFVRQVDGAPPLVMRSTVHLGSFGAPLVEEQLTAAGAFRGPAFLGDGFHLRLLALPPQSGSDSQPADTASVRLYLSHARAVLPWWEGQRELETFLVSFVAFCLGLLVLLWLGQRWKQLDLITQCLLLSVLIHLLLLAWMRRVEILQQVLPATPREGSLEVEIVGPSGTALHDAGGGNGGAGGYGGMTGGELSAMAQFPMGERALDAAAPGSGIAAAAGGHGIALPEGPGPELAMPGLAPGAGASPVQDQAQDAAAAPTRAGREQLGAPAAAALAVAGDEHAGVAAAQQRGTDGPIQIPVPGAAGGGGGGGLPGGGRDLERLALAGLTGAGTGGGPAGAGPEGRAGGDSSLAPRTLTAGAMPVADAVAGEPGGERGGSGSGDGLPALQPAAGGLLAAGTGGSGGSGNAVNAPPAPSRILGEGSGTGGTGALSVRGPGNSGLTAAPRTPGVIPGAGDGPGGSGSPAPSARSGKAIARAVDDRPELPAGPPARSAGGEGRAEGRAGDGTSGGTSGGTPGGDAGALRPSGLAKADGPGSPGGTPMASRTRGELGGTGHGTTSVPLPGSLLSGARGAAGSAGSAGAGSGPLSSGTVPLAAPRRGPAPAGPGLRDAAEPVAGPPGAGSGAGGGSGTGAVAGSGSGRGTGWPAPSPGALAFGSGGPAGGAKPGAPGLVASDAAVMARDGGVRVPGSFLDRAQRQLRTVEPGPPATAHLPGVYANRFGAEKAKALDTFGGTEETEKAVRLGLQYLARVQNRNGSWGNEGIAHPKYGQTFVGKTGLCLLALLGAGHTPQSGTEHSDNAERAVTWLLATQDQDTGHFGTSCAYSHGITTYALAECFALTKDERIKAPLTRGVAWILKNQSRARSLRNQGGWGYFSNHLAPEDTWSRVSVSAWQVMALESARLSGLEVPDEALGMARRFLIYCFDPRNGYFLYNYEPNRLSSTWRTLPASTPAAAFCLQLLGVGAEDPKVATGLRYTLERAPREYRRYSEDEFVRDAGGNVYFWYYGSLACFLAGGETWEQWNTALKQTLPQAQGKDGSFRPIDPYATYAGDNDRERAYTTAMCVLSLEVYYRYFTPLLKPR